MSRDQSTRQWQRSRRMHNRARTKKNPIAACSIVRTRPVDKAAHSLCSPVRRWMLCQPLTPTANGLGLTLPAVSKSGTGQSSGFSNRPPASGVVHCKHPAGTSRNSRNGGPALSRAELGVTIPGIEIEWQRRESSCFVESLQRPGNARSSQDACRLHFGFFFPLSRFPAERASAAEPANYPVGFNSNSK